MDYETLEQSVLDKVTPTAEDNARIQKIKEKVENKINEVASSFGLEGIKPILVGSVSKDTHLRQVDLDIFIMFPKETSREELEKYGLKIGYEVIPDAIELYAEHPYLRGSIDGLNLDLVPCYQIKDSSYKLSAVDRTPFHMEYVVNNLSEEQKPQVRLFKQFLKGIGAYGAEIKVQGFSGYLCEVLIIEFKTFHELLNAVKEWQIPGNTLIIPETISEGFDRATLGKFIEPLIVIDPIDASRNVAAPISEDILILFQRAAKEYLVEPNERFFFPKSPEPMSGAEIKNGIEELDGLIIGIVLNSKSIVQDILYGQVRKSLNAAIKLLEHYEFSVLRSKFSVHETGSGELPFNILLLMELDKYELPAEQVHRGPPLEHANSDNFLKKWKGNSSVLNGPYEKDGRWFVDIKREFTSGLSLLRSQFSSLNHGKIFNESVHAGNYQIYSGTELAEDRFAEALTEFILNKMPWEYK